PNTVDGTPDANYRFQLSNRTHGNLYKGSVAPANLISFTGGVAYLTVAEGQAGIVFLPDPDANDDNTPAGFSFVVKAAVNSTGAGLSSGQTATVTVTSVNDAPVGTANAVSTNKNTPYTFAATDFGFTDPRDNPPNLLL